METTQNTAPCRKNIPTAVHDVPLYVITAKSAHSGECVLPELPSDMLMDALHYAEQSIAAGDGIKNEDIEDFVAAELGWN